MEHDSEKVQPFWCGFYVVGAKGIFVDDRVRHEFSRGCLECAEAGWKRGTD